MAYSFTKNFTRKFDTNSYPHFDNEIDISHIPRDIFDSKLPYIPNYLEQFNVLRSFNGRECDELGSGSYGTVTKHTCIESNIPYAIKSYMDSNTDNNILFAQYINRHLKSKKKNITTECNIIPHKILGNNTVGYKLAMPSGTDLIQLLLILHETENYKYILCRIAQIILHSILCLEKKGIYYTDLKLGNVICIRTAENKIGIYLGDIGSAFPNVTGKVGAPPYIDFIASYAPKNHTDGHITSRGKINDKLMMKVMNNIVGSFLIYLFSDIKIKSYDAIKYENDNDKIISLYHIGVDDSIWRKKKSITIRNIRKIMYICRKKNILKYLVLIMAYYIKCTRGI